MVSSKAQVWITTIDNPYDPFTQWDQWYRFDENSGYATCEHLARIAQTSNELSDAEYEDCIDFAIQTLLNWYEPNEVYVLAIEGQTQPFGKAKSS